MATSLLDYLYNNLPKAYRDRDYAMSYLYRYLSAIVEGGYASVLTDSENIPNLLDPQKCPADFLQFFYRSFGLTYFPDIDPLYHRRLLSNLGGIIQRRGTYSCIYFLSRAITGTNIGVDYYRDEVTNRRTLKVYVICETINQLESLETEMEILGRFLKEYVPYNVDIVIEGNVNVAAIQDTRNDIAIPAATFDYTIRQNPNQP